jgi:exosortase H (IPTLxxWG-CTERM-specific)
MGRPMSRKRRKAASSRHAAPPAAAPSPSGTAGTPGAAAGGSGPGGSGGGASGAARLWRRNRREITFLLLFVMLLGGSFTLISVNQVNDQVIEPFTGGVARLSGAVLNLLGQHVALRGTVIQGPHFAVNIRNGCNGVEAMLIFLAAVLAFPAPWRWRLGGLVLGILAIQVVNLVRVVSLYLTGAYLPHLFDASHTVIWQSVVILFGVLLWIFWANRLPPRDEPAV